MSNTKDQQKDTQLTSAKGYDTSRIMFSKPLPGTIQGGNNGPAISYKRINILTRNPDGSVGELILETPKCFSYGVSENTSLETGAVTGWSFPICLYSQDGATPEEQIWVDKFKEIVEVCKDHVIDNREEIDQFELVRAQLNKFASCLYIKKEKYKENGKTRERDAEGAIPTLYAKLIWSKKNEKFVTNIYDSDDNKIDPLSLKDKRVFTNAAIKIESIFCGGTKISLQVKLYEANIEYAQSGMKRLLSRPDAEVRVLKQIPNDASAPLAFDNEEIEDIVEDDEGSIGSGVGNEDIEDAPPKKAAPPKTIKKAPGIKRNTTKVNRTVA